jgi:hypothetical protein
MERGFQVDLQFGQGLSGGIPDGIVGHKSIHTQLYRTLHHP